MAQRKFQKIRCTAKNRAGEPCKQYAMQGRTVCANHGGKSRAAGPDHHCYKHGRYSKVLPATLSQWYEVARDAPALLSQADEIAVLEARAADLMQGIKESPDAGDTLRTWRRAVQLFDRWQATLQALAAAQQAGDAVRVDSLGKAAAELSQSLGETLHAGATVAERWKETDRVLDERRKFVESERRRMVETSQMLHFTQVAVMFDNLFNRIADEITDGAVLERIAAGFAATVGRPNYGAIEATGGRITG